MIQGLNIYIILQCLILAFFCFKRNSVAYVKYLGLIFCVTSIQRLFFILSTSTNILIQYSFLTIIPNWLTLASPALIYYFIISVFNYPLPRKHYYLVVPSAIYFVLFVSYVLFPHQHFYQIISLSQINELVKLFGLLFQLIICVVLMPVTINPNINPNTLAISKAQVVLFKSSKWILVFWIIRSIISSSIVIANYFPLQQIFFTQLLAFNYWFTPISVIIILLISIYTIIENTSFWDSPSKLSTVHDKYAEINQLKDNFVNPKKKKSLIDNELKNVYLEKLRISLEEEHIFLDCELTLQKMAAHLGISQHQLSSLINAEFNENFNQYINTHRIMVAKAILKDPKHKDITMLAVAIDCGFKSESVFYTAFKRNTGITPNQYKITLL